MKKVLFKFWKSNLIIFFIMMGSGISLVYANFVHSMILNALISLDFILFVRAIVKLMIAYLFFLGFNYYKMKECAKTTQKMSNHLRFNMLDQFKLMNSSEFKKEKEGSYTSWLNNDINQIEQAGFDPLYELMSQGINLALALVALFYVNWSLFFMAVVESFIIMQLPRLLGSKLNKRTIEITKANEEATSKTSNLLSGFSMFYLLNELPYLIGELKKEYQLLEKTKNKKSFLLGKVATLGGLGNIIGQISAYALSGYLVIMGKISVGMISTTTNLSSAVFNTVGNLSQYMASISSVEPLFDKFDTFSSDVLLEDSSLKELSKYDYQYIEFNHLTFSYDNNQPVINNINYRFKKGEKYAIVGNSGSGKSTLMNLMIKNIIPTSGNIKFDMLNINEISTRDLLSQITYIEQKPYVFHGTLRSNIKLGGTISDEEIIKVLMYVGLSEYVHQLDMTITENGDNFSGGQKQRLALARGLVRERSIILLDESTSALDVNTAMAIENLIISIPDKTVIMISHHLDQKIQCELDGILDLDGISNQDE